VPKLGSLGGFVESTAGINLRRSCGEFWSGSFPTGLCFSFLGLGMTGRRLPLLLLRLIAGPLRPYGGVRAGDRSGAARWPIRYRSRPAIGRRRPTPAQLGMVVSALLFFALGLVRAVSVIAEIS
jgi:hypothetical protein